MFISLLYTVAPAVGAFARMNFIDTVNEATYIQDGENYEDRAAAILANGGKPVPAWYKDWEKMGLLVRAAITVWQREVWRPMHRVYL